ncbi:helix-turn-helix domain-containing protein [Sulfobacillus harzensis]|uniref:Helix-turn-helix domain-containing protein n=1 Tax=Sulfobacillus harzensis TaxID=2729629 RepID=A0A7Y0Q4R0_9FIRM|nr:helix-turn-helix domain-containing protein [Sulfobacillus harzensis]NMP24872.1 helix-turn-helix domain-containing protein [Sulfobacillus harzensis]
MKRIAAIVMHGISEFNLGVVCEVFGVPPKGFDGPWYELALCSIDGASVRTQGGLTLAIPQDLAATAMADTVLVPDWPADTRQAVPEALIRTLQAAHARGVRLVSFCTGAFVLAAAGLLDGRRATTHWLWSDRFARQYPQIAVDPQALYVDGGQIMTGAGTAAAIDLALHVVRQDYGADVANRVSRYLVAAPHRDGGQAQFIDVPVPAVHDDVRLASLLSWIVEHLTDPISVEGLAARAAVSPRTFLRRFRAVTGTTPYQWVLRQRIARAQQLLERTSESVERIAELCGFGSAASLRTHFRDIVGTAPLTYRRAFRHSSSPNR